jgi:hypothetical protein
MNAPDFARMSEAEVMALWSALNEHQARVKPIVEAFRVRHGFEWVDRPVPARHPRLRIHRDGKVRLFIDLCIGRDAHGKRVEKFTPDAPYELFGGAHIDAQDERGNGMRIQGGFSWFDKRPFHLVPNTLDADLEGVLEKLEGWNEEYLRSNGEVVRFDRPIRPEDMR